MMKVAVLSSLGDEEIGCVVLGLGSNDDAYADELLAYAMKQLAHLGQVSASDTVVGADFTGRTHLVYHNACVKIELHRAMTWAELKQAIRQVELSCGRRRDGEQVAMDIDVLAVHAHQWHVSQRRLPFKEHEVAGLSKVAKFLLDRDLA